MCDREPTGSARRRGATLSRSRVYGPLLVLAGLALLVTGCAGLSGSDALEDEDGIAATSVDDEPTLQPDDMVDLTVYLRSGSGSDAHLEPVTREVAVTDNLAQRALEELIAGPAAGEEESLRPTLPSSTQVRDVVTDGDLAVVDLSAHVIADADEVGSSPENEALALASISATLTDFPTIEYVQVLVEGEQEGWHEDLDVSEFWGSWGLPHLIRRDDSLIGESSEGDGVPGLDDFAEEPQKVGSADAEPVVVDSLRVRDRTTYVRLQLELADAAEPDASPELVPRVRARSQGQKLVLNVDAVAIYEGEPALGEALTVDLESVAEVQVADTELPGRLRITIELTGDADGSLYRLHSLSSPTRVVLDIKK